MYDRNLTATTKAALFSQETDEVFLVLLQINNAELATPIRVVNNTVNITSNGNLYVGMPFEITLPEDSEDRAPEAGIQIDNVDRQIVQAVRNATSLVTVDISIIRAAAPDTVEVSFPAFELSDARYDSLVVTARLSLDSFLDEPYPAGTFGPGSFPGLF